MGRNRTQEPIGKEYVEFGHKIKELRNSHNITQEEMSEIMGISKTSVVNYETGTRKVPLSMIIKFAEFFKVSVDNLINVNITSNRNEHMILSNNPKVIANTNRWYKEVGDLFLNDEEMTELINYAKYMMYKRSLENGKN